MARCKPTNHKRRTNHKRSQNREHRQKVILQSIGMRVKGNCKKVKVKRKSII